MVSQGRNPNGRIDGFRIGPLIPILSGGFAVVGLLVWTVISLAGSADSGRAVLFPPWYDSVRVMDAVARADGLLVREGMFPNVMIVLTDSPDFSRRVRDLGAWAVSDPILALGCGVNRKSPIEREARLAKLSRRNSPRK